MEFKPEKMFFDLCVEKCNECNEPLIFVKDDLICPKCTDLPLIENYIVVEKLNLKKKLLENLILERIVKYEIMQLSRIFMKIRNYAMKLFNAVLNDKTDNNILEQSIRPKELITSQYILQEIKEEHYWSIYDSNLRNKIIIIDEAKSAEFFISYFQELIDGIWNLIEIQNSIYRLENGYQSCLLAELTKKTEEIINIEPRFGIQKDNQTFYFQIYNRSIMDFILKKIKFHGGQQISDTKPIDPEVVDPYEYYPILLHAKNDFIPDLKSPLNSKIDLLLDLASIFYPLIAIYPVQGALFETRINGKPIKLGGTDMIDFYYDFKPFFESNKQNDVGSLVYFELKTLIKFLEGKFKPKHVKSFIKNLGLYLPIYNLNETFFGIFPFLEYPKKYFPKLWEYLFTEKQNFYENSPLLLLNYSIRKLNTPYGPILRHLAFMDVAMFGMIATVFSRFNKGKWHEKRRWEGKIMFEEYLIPAILRTKFNLKVVNTKDIEDKCLSSTLPGKDTRDCGEIDGVVLNETENKVFVIEAKFLSPNDYLGWASTNSLGYMAMQTKMIFEGGSISHGNGKYKINKNPKISIYERTKWIENNWELLNLFDPIIPKEKLDFHPTIIHDTETPLKKSLTPSDCKVISLKELIKTGL